MANNVLYTIGCPKCTILEKKLKEKNIKYTMVSDRAILINMGFDEMPVFEVDGKRMNFAEAINWINSASNTND